MSVRGNEMVDRGSERGYNLAIDLIADCCASRFYLLCTLVRIDTCFYVKCDVCDVM